MCLYTYYILIFIYIHHVRARVCSHAPHSVRRYAVAGWPAASTVRRSTLSTQHHQFALAARRLLKTRHIHIHTHKHTPHILTSLTYSPAATFTPSPIPPQPTQTPPTYARCRRAKIHTRSHHTSRIKARLLHVLLHTQATRTPAKPVRNVQRTPTAQTPNPKPIQSTTGTFCFCGFLHKHCTTDTQIHTDRKSAIDITTLRYLFGC